MSQPRRCRIAVLGGGAGALSAVYHFTSQPNWQRDFEITVYQLGWRLGGKGASGRNLAQHARIEEHGLHVWPGFYDHAFGMMRHCYAELDHLTPSPWNDWRRAFLPQSQIVLQESIGSRWVAWPFHAPAIPGTPGDPRSPLTPLRLMGGTLRMLQRWLDSLESEQTHQPSPLDPTWPAIPARFLTLVPHWPISSGKIPFRPLLQLIHTWITRNLPVSRLFCDLLLWFIQTLKHQNQRRIPTSESSDTALRRFTIFVDLMTTNLHGMVHDGVLHHGFDRLDHESYIDWLTRHGASRLTLNSALVRGLHDFVFARDPSDPERLNLAAGVALRLSLRTAVGYRGAMMYKMAAGMGDVVFAPLYELLRQRGVTFRFFHRVHALVADRSSRRIQQIHLWQQAQLRSAHYDPLVTVKGIACWPSVPDWSQFQRVPPDPAALESTVRLPAGARELVLREGKDFDLVVAGLPVDVMRQVAGGLAQIAPQWRDMWTHLKTTQTVAAQVWLGQSRRELGWGWNSPIATAYARPFETWSDMSHTLEMETWPEEVTPRSVAYLCGAWPAAADLASADAATSAEETRKNATEAWHLWLNRDAPTLWRRAKDQDGVAARPVRSPGDGEPLAEYLRFHNDPSERYVLSGAGSTHYRIPPGDSGFKNLVLAGDWTRTELNVGCVEGAVESGCRAAEAALGGG